MSLNDITRSAVEDFLYQEAALLDEWRLDEWLSLLTDDAIYQIPSTDAPDSQARDALFLIADDAIRIKARVKRISNVRIIERDRDTLAVNANFSVFRYRRNAPLRQFVGRYEYLLRVTAEGLRIAERRVILDPTELGMLGAVSFIL